MIYYAKQIDENNNIVALHTMDKPFIQTDIFIPITEEEYLILLAEFEKELNETNNESIEEAKEE